MSQELTAPPTVQEDPIGTALIAAGVTSAAIEQLAKDYGELAQLTEITSDEQRDVVHRAQMAHRDIRVAVVAALKEEREQAIRYQKFVVSEEKRIVGTIEKTELPLKKLKDDWDHKAELKALEEAKKWAERMNLRKQAAFDIGYYFNGAHYLLDRENGEPPWVLAEDQIGGLAMSDETLYALLEAQAAELKMTREIKAEAEAKAQEEREAQAAAAKAEADRLAAAQAEIERREKEMQAREAAMNAKVNEARKNELLAMGCEVGDLYVGVRAADGKFMDILQDVTRLYVRSDAEWESDKAQYAEKIRQRDEEARVRREQQEQERIAREEQLKAEAAQRAVEAERLRIAQEQEAKEKAQELLEEQEREKALQASDKEKVDSLAHSLYCEFIDMDPLPVLKSAIGQAAMKSYAKQFRDIHASMVKLSNEL